MLTGTIRNDIDKLWEKFWTGGITNPLTVIEQISYLMFARMLDMQETQKERIASRTGQAFTRNFPESEEGQLLRWKNFQHMAGEQLLPHLRQKVYPHFNEIKLGDSGLSDFMRDADVEIKSPSLLKEAISMVEALPLGQSDIKGDIYEYLLSKLTTAGINGQFRTPRHIIDLMVQLLDPKPDETICDPACGTAGFLARAMEYLNKKYSDADGTFEDEEGNKHYSGNLLAPYRKHIEQNMFWGFDFDSTMLRVSAMNMLLHGVNNPNIHYQDSLNKSWQENPYTSASDVFDIVLANPPFKGSLDATSTNKKVLDIVSTKKTELLFVAHILNILKVGGKSATVVPDGVLFGSSKAHQQLRKELLENNQLEAIISLPSGVFKPYAGVSTAIIVFTKGGTTENVWFYDVQADGYSLDDKRTELKGEGTNDLPDVLTQWTSFRHSEMSDHRAGGNPEKEQPFEDRTQKAFTVPKEEIANNKYDLSINRYKEVVYEEEVYDPPKVILKKLKDLENDILKDLDELEAML